MARKKLNVLYFNDFEKAVLYIFKCTGCFLFILLFWCNEATAQQFNKQVSVYGVVKDKNTGEILPFANITEPAKKLSITSNDYGFYSIKVTKGALNFNCTYVGYKTFTKKLIITSDTLVDILLVPLIQTLDEVIIKDTQIPSLKTRIGIKTIPLQKAKQLPAILGEVDLLKTVQLLPGIQSGHEGSSGIFVRGGGGDQNLFIIDGVPIYNAMHLLGFVSVFNEDAVSSMKVYTDGFPARYQGRLSSVIDIKTREGNFYKNEGSLSIGLLSAKFNINGPIKKGKGSFFISGRRSYIDWLARPIIKELADDAILKLNFYDLNGKANYILSKKDHLYLSFYFGKDNYGKTFKQSQDNQTGFIEEQSVEELKWGNFVASARWNHIWTKKLFSKLSLSYTDYKYHNIKNYTYKTTAIYTEYSYQFVSGINDVNLSLSFDYYPNQNHNFKVGINGTHHTFFPGITLESNVNRDTTFGYNNICVPEISGFVEDTWKINNRLIVMPGVSSTIFYTIDKTFFYIEPRLSATYIVKSNLSIKFSYSKMSQFLHFLRFSTINLPTDLWIPSSNKLSPEISNQFSIGVFYSFQNILDFSIETYYKSLDNIVEYEEGTSLFKANNGFEEFIETGQGRSYGIELMMKKQHGRLNGWISYTLSKSDRLFNNINQGKIFPFRFDRRHDLSIVGSYKINKKVDIGATWIFGSGYPVTMSTSKYASYFLSALNGEAVPSPNGFSEINYYPYRNNYRMPAFHHLDISFNFHKKLKYGARIFSTGIYNVYNRLNAFYLEEKDGKLYKVSLFPITPFIRFTLKFY